MSARDDPFTVGNAIAGGGIGLGLLMGGLVWILVTGQARANAKVITATADLATAEAEARRQAGLLTAVMDSISDGVGVVDERGEFLLHNPAAKAMLGLSMDKGGAENWQSHYGIYQPDGETPFPTEQLPLVRALAGEATEQVEMVVRRTGRSARTASRCSSRKPSRSSDTATGAPASPTHGRQQRQPHQRNDHAESRMR